MKNISCSFIALLSIVAAEICSGFASAQLTKLNSGRNLSSNNDQFRLTHGLVAGEAIV